MPRRNVDPGSDQLADRGASALELAFIAPSLILVIFFVVQVALFFYGRSVALQTAREGVSQLRLAQNRNEYDGMQSDVKAAMVTFARNVGGGTLGRPKPTSVYSEQQDSVTVHVTGNTISLVPLLHLTVTETASGRIEHFENPPGLPQGARP